MCLNQFLTSFHNKTAGPEAKEIKSIPYLSYDITYTIIFLWNGNKEIKDQSNTGNWSPPDIILSLAYMALK